MEHFKWLIFSKRLDKYVDYMKLKAISFTNANNFSVSAWTPSKTIENEWKLRKKVENSHIYNHLF